MKKKNLSFQVFLAILISPILFLVGCGEMVKTLDTTTTAEEPTAKVSTITQYYGSGETKTWITTNKVHYWREGAKVFFDLNDGTFVVVCGNFNVEAK